MILNLPVEVASIIESFAALFSRRVWYQAQVLIVGAIQATGKRTVTSILGVMGLSEDKHFQNYHRVLNRAVWSSLAASRALLMILITIFAASGPIVIGMDDTIERRKGEKIKAKGIYREERTFKPRTLSKSQWSTLVKYDVIGGNTLGRSESGHYPFLQP